MKSYENHEARFPNFSVFIGQKSIFCRYCIQNVKDRIQTQVYNELYTQVYNVNNESVNHFSQFISVKVKKTLRNFTAQFREKVKKIDAQAKRRFSYRKKRIFVDS